MKVLMGIASQITNNSYIYTYVLEITVMKTFSLFNFLSRIFSIQNPSYHCEDTFQDLKEIVDLILVQFVQDELSNQQDHRTTALTRFPFPIRKVQKYELSVFRDKTRRPQMLTPRKKKMEEI